MRGNKGINDSVGENSLNKEDLKSYFWLWLQGIKFNLGTSQNLNIGPTNTAILHRTFGFSW